jgi:hypothetical protein
MLLGLTSVMKIAWFTIGVTFRTYQGEAGKTNNRITYAVGRPEVASSSFVSPASFPHMLPGFRLNTISLV